MKIKEQFRETVKLARNAHFVFKEEPPSHILKEFRDRVAEYGYEAMMCRLIMKLGEVLSELGKVCSLVVILDSDMAAAKKPEKKATKKKAKKK